MQSKLNHSDLSKGHPKNKCKRQNKILPGLLKSSGGCGNVVQPPRGWEILGGLVPQAFGMRISQRACRLWWVLQQQRPAPPISRYYQGSLKHWAKPKLGNVGTGAAFHKTPFLFLFYRERDCLLPWRKKNNHPSVCAVLKPLRSCLSWMHLESIFYGAVSLFVLLSTGGEWLGSDSGQAMPFDYKHCVTIINSLHNLSW